MGDLYILNPFVRLSDFKTLEIEIVVRQLDLEEGSQRPLIAATRNWHS